jgi:hypothetical protein
MKGLTSLQRQIGKKLQTPKMHEVFHMNFAFDELELIMEITNGL